MQVRALGFLVAIGTVSGFVAVSPAQDAEPAGATGPKMELIQTIRNGEGGVTKMAAIAGLQIQGDYLYVGGKKSITWFKRDVKTGQLAYAGTVAVNDRIGNTPCLLALAGGRLYAAGKALAWYEIDPKTGQLVEKGVTECNGATAVITGPDQKDLYVFTQPPAHHAGTVNIAWYRIDADGKPVQSREVTGEGILFNHFSSLVAAPDGKTVYSLSDFIKGAVVCLARAPNGEIAHRQCIDLEQVSKIPRMAYHRQWCELDLTPDGKWLYASISKTFYEGGTNAPCQTYLFKRDAATGDLAFQEVIKDRVRHLQFLPDSTGGFLARPSGSFESFALDHANGHLTTTGRLPELDGQAAMNLALDAENGLLYAATFQWDGYEPPASMIKSNAGDCLFVIRTGKGK